MNVPYPRDHLLRDGSIVAKHPSHCPMRGPANPAILGVHWNAFFLFVSEHQLTMREGSDASLLSIGKKVSGHGV